MTMTTIELMNKVNEINGTQVVGFQYEGIVGTFFHEITVEENSTVTITEVRGRTERTADSLEDLKTWYRQLITADKLPLVSMKFYTKKNN